VDLRRDLPGQAFQVNNFRDDQIFAMIDVPRNRDPWRLRMEAIMTTADAAALGCLRSKAAPDPVGWEPNVIAFACHYCAFAAADLAGVMRLSYPPNVKVIRLPCTGKLDHMHLLRAFEKGVDGIFVAG
jgi:hypothetical protein